MEDKNKSLMNDKRIWLILLLLLIAFGTYFWYKNRQPVNNTLPVQNENAKVDTTAQEQVSVYVDSTKSKGAWEYKVVTAPTGERLVMNTVFVNKRDPFILSNCQEMYSSMRVTNNNNQGNLLYFQLPGVDYTTNSLKITFDEKDAQQAAFSKDPYNNPGAVVLDNAASFIEKMKKSNKVTIEVNLKNYGTKKFDFSTSGFIWDK